MRGRRMGYGAPRQARLAGLGDGPATASHYGARPGDSSFPVMPMRDIPTIVYKKDGSAWLNRAKDVQKVFWLSPDLVPIVVPAGGRQTTALVAPPEENLRGDFEIVKLMSTQTGDFAVEFNQPTTNRQFMNAPVFHEFVFGTAQLPAALFDTALIETTTALNMTLVDLSAAPNTVLPVGFGRRMLDYGHGGIDREGYLRSYYTSKKHPFWLTFDDGPQFVLAANQAVELIMSVPGAGDFELWQLMTDSTGTYDIEILEGASARALMNRPLDAASFVASPSVAVAGFPGGRIRAASLPFVVGFSHLFKRNTRIRVRLTDTSGAPNTVRFAMHGRLVYYQPADPLGGSVERGQSLPVPQGPRPVPDPRGLVPDYQPGPQAF